MKKIFYDKNAGTYYHAPAFAAYQPSIFFISSSGVLIRSKLELIDQNVKHAL